MGGFSQMGKEEGEGRIEVSKTKKNHEVTSLAGQLVEATAYKAYKICHVVGVKKASAIVLYEKRRLKISEKSHGTETTQRLDTLFFPLLLPVL